MKQTTSVAEMPASNESLLVRDRRECDVRSRERIEGEMDRLRTRERLEATFAGLGELEYLRQRQELLVRSVLNRQENSAFDGEEKVCGSVEDNYLSSEEKLLEENILLLRKQLNCLRRRDAGLINQLQELDRQISDLRLDTEKVSHDQGETDSRPSSGFYELSDGASGSLSNSSNSVFSECLSSCRSSTCFCSPLEASLSTSEGRPKCTDDLADCTECESQCEDQSSGAIRRSYSAPYSPSVDGAPDVQSKFHCDLVAKNGSDVYRYPSPLHAVAVQSPMFLQSLIGHMKEEGAPPKAGEPLSDFLKPEPPSVSQSTSWPASWAPSSKRLDNYIFGLLQRRAQPVRTNKPRTSINTDPSKSILRQASLCVRQASSQSQGRTPDHKTNWQASLHGGLANAVDVGAGSPLKQRAVEAKAELLENGKSHLLTQPQTKHLANNGNVHTNSLSKKKGFVGNKSLPLNAVSKDYQELGSPHAVSSPKENKYPYFPMHEEAKAALITKADTPKNCKSAPTVQEERPTPELVSLGSSSQSQDEGGQMVSAEYIPAQKQAVKLRKGGGKNVKVVKVKSATLRSRAPYPEPLPEAGREKQRAGPKKCRFPEDVPHPHRASKKTSSRVRRLPASIPEGRIMDKHPLPSLPSTTMGKLGAPRHHGREAVLAKPKYKRGDYRRLRSITELPYEEALRRARRRHKRQVLAQGCTMYLPSTVQYASPYAYVGSDSEYSAECASLFHSTILDTSEDEQSNYTTNCFGDSESSLSEVDFVGESTTTSDSEESGGVNWPQFGQSAGPVLPQEMTSAQAKAFVKIKASHNLKKKILRFRSGSLKLMTTV